MRSSDGTHEHKVPKDLSGCYEPNGTLCIAFKYRRTCGHLKSVETYIKQNRPKVRKTYQELLVYLSQRKWVNYLMLVQNGFSDELIDSAVNNFEVIEKQGRYHILN